MNSMNNWRNAKAIADLRVVQSSYIWLFLAPFAAKALTEIDKVITLNILGQPFQITTTLPFSWEALFYAAIFFTLGNIIYGVRCPEILRGYKDYTQFRDSGKTMLQTHSALRQIAVDSEGRLIPKYEHIALTYLKRYSPSHIHEHVVYLDQAFDDTSASGRHNNDAESFYRVQELANHYRERSIAITLILYSFGIFLVTIIFIQNLNYVLSHSSLMSIFIR